MPRPVPKCGTEAAYRRHRRIGERPCDECTAAHAAENQRITAKCGTDAGYYRHRRVEKEDACDDCTRAHAAAQRRYNHGQKSVRRHCPCGVALRTTLSHCSRCRKKGVDKIAEKPSPVAWIRKGRILVAVYEQRTEVA